MCDTGISIFIRLLSVLYFAILENKCTSLHSIIDICWYCFT